MTSYSPIQPLREVLVSAVDSAAADIASAKYRCSGSSDEALINAAITAAGVGGLVRLAKGTYNIAAAIQLLSSRKIVSEGATIDNDIADIVLYAEGTASSRISKVRMEGELTLNCTNRAFTASAATDVLTFTTAHGKSDGSVVRLVGDSLPNPLANATSYYVVNSTSTTMQLSETSGGAAINITEDGAGAVANSGNSAVRLFYCDDVIIKNLTAITPGLNGLETYYSTDCWFDDCRTTKPTYFGAFYLDCTNCGDNRLVIDRPGSFGHEFKDTFRCTSTDLQMLDPLSEHGLLLWTGWDTVGATPAPRLNEFNSYVRPYVRTISTSKHAILCQGSPNTRIIDPVIDHNSAWQPIGVSGLGWGPTDRIAFSADSGTDTLTAALHGYSNGDIVRVHGTDLPEPLVDASTYYVISAATNTFQLSSSSGGSAVDLTDNGSGTMTINGGKNIVNDNIVIENPTIYSTDGVPNVTGMIALSGDASNPIKNFSVTNPDIRGGKAGIYCTYSEGTISGGHVRDQNQRQSFVPDTAANTVTPASNDYEDEDLVRFYGDDLPAGLSENIYYYLVNESSGAYQLQWRRSFSLTDTVGDVMVCYYHGFENNDVVRVSGGSLPSPLVVDTDYHVINKTDTTLQLSATSGGAAINLTTTGSGFIFEEAVNITDVGSGTIEMSDVPLDNNNVFVGDAADVKLNNVRMSNAGSDSLAVRDTGKATWTDCIIENADNLGISVDDGAMILAKGGRIADCYNSAALIYSNNEIIDTIIDNCVRRSSSFGEVIRVNGSNNKLFPRFANKNNFADAWIRVNAGSDNDMKVIDDGSMASKIVSTSRLKLSTGVSSDNGDASVTVNADDSEYEQRFDTTLTAERTVTLGRGWHGARFRIVRTGAGAFNLVVGSTNLAADEWCEVVYNGSAWVLSAKGSL